MKIYTKTGDKGTTSLIGGKRVYKCDDRIESYGTIDELISFVSLLNDQENLDIDTNIILQTIKSTLMLCATRIACYDEQTLLKYETIELDDILFLEKEIDRMDLYLDKLDSFILPGGNQTISLCHVCRTISRRSERLLVKLIQNNEIVDENVLIYINRLSDYFFTLGRYYVKMLNVNEVKWKI